MSDLYVVNRYRKLQPICINRLLRNDLLLLLPLQVSMLLASGRWISGRNRWPPCLSAPPPSAAIGVVGLQGFKPAFSGENSGNDWSRKVLE